MPLIYPPPPGNNNWGVLCGTLTLLGGVENVDFRLSYDGVSNIVAEVSEELYAKWQEWITAGSPPLSTPQPTTPDPVIPDPPETPVVETDSTPGSEPLSPEPAVTQPTESEPLPEAPADVADVEPETGTETAGKSPTKTRK